jgi:hypothetical protein
MGPRRARRRGIVVGAAVASSRNKKAQVAASQQPAAEPVANTEDNSIDQLKQLAQLKDQGILTQEEFDAR